MGFFSFSFILIIFFVVLLFFIEQFALTDPIQWADKGYEDGRNQFPKCPSKREKKTRLSDFNEILFLGKFDDLESNIQSQKIVL